MGEQQFFSLPLAISVDAVHLDLHEPLWELFGI